MEHETLSVRAVGPGDVALLFKLIHELAAYERLSHAVTATEADIRDALFGPSPVLDAIIAWRGSQAVGFATYTTTYSTFQGRRCLYVEDLFVRKAVRGHGIGRALMAHLARIAEFRRCSRMAWAVLDWNETALSFYRSLGARPVAGWLSYQLGIDAMTQLARHLDTGESSPTLRQ